MKYLIMPVIIVAIFFIVAALRKGTSAVKNKPSKLLSFSTEVQPNDVFKIVIKYAQQSGYKVDDLDETNGRVILSDSATLISYGFFYPVYIEKQTGGNTLVEVGIKSKIFQYGFLVTRNREKCFNGIKAAVFAEKTFSSGNSGQKSSPIVKQGETVSSQPKQTVVPPPLPKTTFVPPPLPKTTVVPPPLPKTKDNPPPLPPEEEWLLGIDGKQDGPFKTSKIKELLSSGKIESDDTYVWKTGMADWKPISEIEKFKRI